MSGNKMKKKAATSKADLEMISGSENLLIEKEKRYQQELRKSRKPQVEKLTTLKETKKKPASKVKAKAKARR